MEKKLIISRRAERGRTKRRSEAKTFYAGGIEGRSRGCSGEAWPLRTRMPAWCVGSGISFSAAPPTSSRCVGAIISTGTTAGSRYLACLFFSCGCARAYDFFFFKIATTSKVWQAPRSAWNDAREVEGATSEGRRVANNKARASGQE